VQLLGVWLQLEQLLEQLLQVFVVVLAYVPLGQDVLLKQVVPYKKEEIQLKQLFVELQLPQGSKQLTQFEEFE
jgi:hypothetical protein